LWSRRLRQCLLEPIIADRTRQCKLCLLRRNHLNPGKSAPDPDDGVRTIADSQERGWALATSPRANARERDERYGPRSLPCPDHDRPGVTLRNPRSSPRPPVTGPPVPAGEDRVHHIAHDKPAGTRAYVYNRGCKHFCTQDILATVVDLKSGSVYPYSILSFTTRRKTVVLYETTGNGNTFAM